VRDLLNVVVVSIVGLSVTLAAVLGGDSTIAVPPPESVGEQFARQIAAGRYDRALQYVDERSGITLTTVRRAANALDSTAGNVHQVEGEPGRIEGERATASAVLMTERAGRVKYHYRLVRNSGVWKIVEWEAGWLGFSRHSTKSVGYPTRLAQLFFDCVVRELGLSTELVCALQVKRELLFEERHPVELFRPT
jgi:hypothetical protein